MTSDQSLLITTETLAPSAAPIVSPAAPSPTVSPVPAAASTPPPAATTTIPSDATPDTCVTTPTVTPSPPPAPTQIEDPPGVHYSVAPEERTTTIIEESRLLPQQPTYHRIIPNINKNDEDCYIDDDYNYTFTNVKPRFQLLPSGILFQQPLRMAIAAITATTMGCRNTRNNDENDYDNNGRLLQRARRYRLTLQSYVFPIVTVLLIVTVLIFGIRSLTTSRRTHTTTTNTIDDSNNGMHVSTTATTNTISTMLLFSVTDLRSMCPDGDSSSLDTYQIPDDIVQRRDDFASFVTLHDAFSSSHNKNRLALRSCSSSNLAVLFLAAHPPLDHMNDFKIRYALTSLYFSTYGEENWTRQNNWLDEDTDVCHWGGVTCNEVDDVVSVVLTNNNLIGTLPIDDIVYLDTVQVLDLSMNSISGTVPSSIAKLSNLVQLELGYNQFTGTVPNFIFQQDQYEILDFAHFGGTLGTIPSSWICNSLRRFMAPQTRASGRLPSELGSCTNLAFLDLSKNSLDGTVPSELGTLDGLQTLYLGENNNLTISTQLCRTLTNNLLAFDLKDQC